MASDASSGGIYAKLKGFAASFWFPFLVGAMSGINVFTLVLSAPTALLYVTGALAKPSRVPFLALINAVGTMIGVIALVYLINENGIDYIQTRFSTLFESDKWKSVTTMLESSQEYGILGIVLVSALPIILHPIIMFCLLAKMDQTVFLGAIFAGRVLKYCVMGYLASAAPGALKLFGVDINKVSAPKKKE